jgi:hypothetical protein
MQEESPRVITKVSLASGEMCLRSFAGMLILPLLSIEYVNCPLNITFSQLFHGKFHHFSPLLPKNNIKTLGKSRFIGKKF